MRAAGVAEDSYVLAKLLKLCGMCGTRAQLDALAGDVRAARAAGRVTEHDERALQSALIAAYGRMGDLAQARAAFERARAVVSSREWSTLYSTIIGALTQRGGDAHVREAIALADEALEQSVAPQAGTLAVVIKLYAEHGLLERAERGIEQHRAALVRRVGTVSEEARRAYRAHGYLFARHWQATADAGEQQRAAASANVPIAQLVRLAEAEKPVTALAAAYASVRRTDRVDALLAAAGERAYGAEVSSVTYAAVVAALARAGDMAGARQYVERCAAQVCSPAEPAAELYQALRARGRLDDALALYRELKARGVAPSAKMTASVLRDTARSASLSARAGLIDVVAPDGSSAAGAASAPSVPSASPSSPPPPLSAMVSQLAACAQRMRPGHRIPRDERAQLARVTDALVRDLERALRVDELRAASDSAVPANADELTLERAQLVRDNLPFNVLMMGYRALSRTDGVEQLLAAMRRAQIPVDAFTYGEVLSALAEAQRGARLLEAFGAMMRDGVAPTTVHFTVLFQHFGRLGQWKQVGDVLRAMREREVPLDDTGCAVLVRLYGDAQRWDELFRFVESAVTHAEEARASAAGASPALHHAFGTDTLRALIRVLSRGGQMPFMDRIVDAYERDQPDALDATHYTELANGWGHHGDVERMLGVVARMDARGVAPTRATFNVQLAHATRLGRLDLVPGLLEQARAHEVAPDTTTVLSVLAAAERASAERARPGAVRARTVLEAVRLLEGAGVSLDLQCYTKLLHVLAHLHRDVHASLVEGVVARIDALAPSTDDAVLHGTLIDAFARLRDVPRAERYWARLVASGAGVSSASGAALLRAHRNHLIALRHYAGPRGAAELEVSDGGEVVRRRVREVARATDEELQARAADVESALRACVDVLERVPVGARDFHVYLPAIAITGWAGRTRSCMQLCVEAARNGMVRPRLAQVARQFLPADEFDRLRRHYPAFGVLHDARNRRPDTDDGGVDDDNEEQPRARTARA